MAPAPQLEQPIPFQPSFVPIPQRPGEAIVRQGSLPKKRPPAQSLQAPPQRRETSTRPSQPPANASHPPAVNPSQDPLPPGVPVIETEQPVKPQTIMASAATNNAERMVYILVSNFRVGSGAFESESSIGSLTTDRTCGLRSV